MKDLTKVAGIFFNRKELTLNIIKKNDQKEKIYLHEELPEGLEDRFGETTDEIEKFKAAKRITDKLTVDELHETDHIFLKKDNSVKPKGYRWERGFPHACNDRIEINIEELKEQIDLKNLNSISNKLNEKTKDIT